MPISRVHRVQPGDWLGSIALTYDVRPSALWEHPSNAPLRELRGSSDLLMVGDELRIPDADDGGGVEVPTGVRVVFRKRGGDRLRLRVAGVGLLVEAFGPVAYRLELGDAVVDSEFTAQTGDVIDVPLPPTAKRVRLTIGGWSKDLAIGGLGPVREASGAHARLVNLGFGDPPGADAVAPGTADRADDPSMAVRRFQRRHGLADNAELDEPTLAKLAGEYGDTRGS